MLHLGILGHVSGFPMPRIPKQFVHSLDQIMLVHQVDSSGERQRCLLLLLLGWR